MARENVKIPEKHYVGMQKRHGEGLPLGFMTPWGEDAAAAKRIATVDSWAGRSGLPAVTIDNIPMSGFRLTKSIRTTNYGGHDHWRVEDPRGFELEISSGNLAQLISVGTVENGEFLDECVWARHGANNVLLSTSTEEYKEAIENTRVAGLKASWKEVRFGDRVVLQNNLRGIWLGRVHRAEHGYNDQRDTGLGANEVSVSSKLTHMILRDGSDVSGYARTLHGIASPKLSYVEPCETPLTEAEVEVMLNDLLKDKSVYKEYTGYRSPLVVSLSPIKIAENLTLRLAPLDETDPQAIESMLTGYDREMILGRMADGTIGTLSKYSQNKEASLSKISESHLAQAELRRIQAPVSRNRSWYSGGSYSFQESTVECPLADVTEFYRLEIQVQTKVGNTLTAFMR